MALDRPALTSVVLAGGRSARLGADKALQLLRGKPLLQWVVDCLATFSTEIIIATAGGESIPCLCEVPLRHVVDVYPGRGPLGGIFSGLLASSQPTAVVVGCDMPFLRTHGTDENTGIIVHHILMDSTGAVPSYTTYVTGVLPTGPSGVTPILAEDSRISMTQIIDRHGPATQDINTMREQAGYERMPNHIVIVEVFFLHRPLWNNPFVPLPDPWMMRAQTEMRVVTDRGSLQ